MVRPRDLSLGDGQPVREALQRLRQMGLVEIVHGADTMTYRLACTTLEAVATAVSALLPEPIGGVWSSRDRVEAVTAWLDVASADGRLQALADGTD